MLKLFLLKIQQVLMNTEYFSLNEVFLGIFALVTTNSLKCVISKLVTKGMIKQFYGVTS